MEQVLPNGWALLGELDKFIGVSRQRITNLTIIEAPAGSSIKIRLEGTAGEVVHLSAARHEDAERGALSVAGEAPKGSWKLCTTDIAIGSDGSAESVLPPTGSYGDCKTWSDR